MHYRKTLTNLFFIIVSFCLIVSAGFAKKGPLVIIGGGNRPSYLIQRIIELSGGDDSKIVIVPNASSQPLETAQFQMEQFKSEGAGEVDFLSFTDESADEKENFVRLKGATCIFFSGGDQSRLTGALLGTALLKEIRGMHERGCVISGTSAGAAVMSEIMITGNEKNVTEEENPFIAIKIDNIETRQGFGFVKRAIIDQHFVMRKRENRLISLVLENSELLGIGIDESTAIIIGYNDKLEVLGDNSVMIFDAHKAQNIKADKSGNMGANNIKTHILLSGDKFDMKRRKVFR